MDHKTLENAVAGSYDDNHAIRTLYQQVGPKILGYVMNNSGSRADGEDLINSTLLKVIENLRAGKYKSTGQFQAYVVKVAVNIWHQELRNRKKQPPTSSLENKDHDSLAENSEDEIYWKVVTEKKYEAMYKALEQLRENCQKFLKLFYFEKKSQKEIAGMFNLTPATLKQRMHVCRDNWRKEAERNLSK